MAGEMGEKIMTPLASPSRRSLSQTAPVLPLEESYARQSSAVFSRGLDSVEHLSRQGALQTLLNILERFSVQEDPWSDDQPEKITRETFLAARSFLKQLPGDVRLPKISPDGEGSLVFLWEGISPLLITMEDWRIHVVKGATTPGAEYIDDIPFGDDIPDAVLRVLPRG